MGNKKAKADIKTRPGRDLSIKADIPNELAQVDAEILKKFHGLNDEQQAFLIGYLQGKSGAEAYRDAYGLPYGNQSAASSASLLLRHPNVTAVLEAFKGFRDEDLILVRKTYIAAATEAIKPIYGKDADGQPEKVEDLPDHAVRIKAAEALAKLHGLNAAEKKEISGSVTIQSTASDENL